jgi:hypothetical protein
MSLPSPAQPSAAVIMKHTQVILATHFELEFPERALLS